MELLKVMVRVFKVRHWFLWRRTFTKSVWQSDAANQIILRNLGMLQSAHWLADWRNAIQLRLTSAAHSLDFESSCIPCDLCLPWAFIKWEQIRRLSESDSHLKLVSFGLRHFFNSFRTHITLAPMECFYMPRALRMFQHAAPINWLATSCTYPSSSPP